MRNLRFLGRTLSTATARAATKTELKIGKLSLNTKLILSPLEGVSDCGFRECCHANGAGLTWTEMIRAQAVAKNNRATLDLIDTHSAAVPTGIQLLAKSPDDLQQALERLEALASDGSRPHFRNIVAVDLNFGCPSPSVIREGAGPALLSRRKRLRDLFAVLVAWKNKPGNVLDRVGAVGCKIRLGLNHTEMQSHKVYLHLVRIAAEEGLDYVTVHARHAQQRSSDTPTWGAIAEAKAAAGGMPVIGNGDVRTPAEAFEMLRSTECDGIMLARAAIRNPWIFSHLNAALEEGTAPGVDASFDRIAWPSESQVVAAKRAYQMATTPSATAHLTDSSAFPPTSSTTSSSMTKEKYARFHDANFNRLLYCARSGDHGAKVLTPRTIHML